MNKDFTLIQKLVSRLPVINLYPTKHKRVEKAPLSYSHVSQKIIMVKNPDVNSEEKFVQRVVGVTYRKTV